MNTKNGHKLIFLIFFISGCLFSPFSLALTQSFNLVPAQNAHLSCSGYHQSTAYTCGPAATMALLHYYGRLSGGDMNQNTELKISSEMGTSCYAGTSPEQVAAWLGKNGFSVQLGHKVSTDLLEDSINRGIPVLVVLEHHWTLATGYSVGSDNNDQITFTDSCLKKLVLTRAQIDSMWLRPLCNGSKCNGNIGDYIVATPQ